MYHIDYLGMEFKKNLIKKVRLSKKLSGKEKKEFIDFIEKNSVSEIKERLEEMENKIWEVM